MNRLDKLFAEKKKDILNVYHTAGYPKLGSTAEVMQALQDNGVDIILPQQVALRNFNRHVYCPRKYQSRFAITGKFTPACAKMART